MTTWSRRLTIVFALPLATLAADESTPAFHLQVGRYGAAAVAISNTVYLAGGSGEPGMLDSIEAFDLASAATRLLDLKVMPRRYHAASVWSNGFVLVGGTANQREDRMEWVDPAQGTLHLLPPLPRPRSFVSTAVVQGRLFVVGGNLPSSTRCGFVDIYDFATGAWSRGPDMPTSRDTAVVVIGNHLYALGGYNGVTAVTTVERLDLDRMVWEARPPLPQKQSAHRAIYDGDRVYLFGDYADLDRVVAGHPDAGDWQVLDVPYQPARHAAAAQVDEQLILAGGNTNGSDSYLDLIQVFTSAQLRDARPKPAPSRDADADPVQTWARTATERMSQWSNVIIRGQLDYGYTLEGVTYTSSSPYELIFQPPDRLVYRTGDMRVWYDGTTFAVLKLRGGVWRRMEAGGEAAIYLGEAAREIFSAMPKGHQGLFNERHRAAFMDHLKRMRATLEGTREWKGHTLHQVASYMTNRMERPPYPGFRMGVDQETGLTLVEESISPAPDPAGPRACRREIEHIMDSLFYRFEATQVTVNSDIPPDIFTPPEDRPDERCTHPDVHPQSLDHLLTRLSLLRARRQNPTTLTVPARLVWRSALCADSGMNYAWGTLMNRIPVTHALAVSNDAWYVINLRDGSTTCRLPPPEPAPRNMTAVWLDGGAHQQDLVVLALEDADRPARSRGAHRFQAYDTSGQLVWEFHTPGQGFDHVAALPCGRDQPMMLGLAHYNGVQFYDFTGHSLGAIDRTGTDALELADRNGDGLLEITVLGEDITRYEWTPAAP